MFRSGATWQRVHGKVFYFRPGHETYTTYHDENVQRVILNGVRWARPLVNIPDKCPNSPPLELLPGDPESEGRSHRGHR